MKKILLFLVGLATATLTVFAQAPEGINYQAVARDGSGSLIKNTNLIVKMTVLSGSGGTTQVYQESHGASTNDYGLFTLQLGKGAPLSGTFSSIAWGSDEFWVQVEIDNGSGFVDMGKSQMMSVPYALYAASSGSGGGSSTLNSLTDVNAPSPTTNQVLSWNGTAWVPITTSGGTTYGAGTGITLSGTTFNAQNTTAIWNANELQGRTVASTNPSTNQVLKWNGSQWAPAADAGGASYSGGTGITLSGSTFNAQTTTALWNANQLQGRTISTTAPTNNQVLTWNGSQWIPANASGGSPWTVTGNNIYKNSGKVSIGTTSLTYKFTVAHSPTSSTNNRAINVEHTGFTDNTANSFGLRSEMIGNGSLQNIAVYGESNGSADATTGSNFGGRFLASATTSDNAFGIRATADDGATTRNYGVYGESFGNSGTFNIGAILLADGNSIGSTNTNYGIYAMGENPGTGQAYSIYADASTDTDYAGYFNGDVEVMGTFTNPSDRRLKTNITPLSNSLDRINSLKVYTYNFDPKGDYARLTLPTGLQFGFIAQEMEEVFPELVRDNKVPNNKGVIEGEEVELTNAEYKSVNNVGLIPVLTKAIQEQQLIIDEQSKQIENLMKAVEELQNK